MPAKVGLLKKLGSMIIRLVSSKLVPNLHHISDPYCLYVWVQSCTAPGAILRMATMARLG